MRTALLITLLALTTLGCSKRDKSTSQDILVYGRGSDSQSLDPVNVDDGESIKVQVNLYERLVRIDFDGKMIPSLATSWEALPGSHRGYRFTIRSGVSFHDKTPLTPEAVVFSLRRLLDSKSGYKPYYTSIDRKGLRVEGNTVVVPTTRPDPHILRRMTMFPASIVSPTAIEKHGDSFADHPVGTGPFRLAEWIKDQKVVLVRNENYWGEKSGVARIEFWKSRDNSSRFNKLLNGDFSYIDNFNAQDIEAIRKHPDLSIIMREPGKEISLLYLAMNTTREPLNNPTFRRAIAHAIDKEKIASLFFGIAQPADQAVPPGIPGHSNRVQGISLDLELAKKLLENSGVTRREFTLIHMSNPRPYIRQPHQIARALRANLKRIGITLKIEKYPWKKYLPLVQAHERKHDFCLLGWSPDEADADNFLSTFYDSRNARPGSALNVSFFQDPKMDELLARQRNALDQGEREAALDAVYRHANEKNPIVPLVYVSDMIAFHKLLQNVRFHPLGEKLLSTIRMNASDDRPESIQ